jgi:hypothetical protein
MRLVRNAGSIAGARAYDARDPAVDVDAVTSMDLNALVNISESVDDMGRLSEDDGAACSIGYVEGEY